MLDIHAILKRLQVPVPLPSAWLGSECHGGGGAELMTRSAIDGSSAGTLTMAGAPLVDAAAAHARGAFHTWRQVPAPVRGELVRRFGNALRIYKTDLASLVSWEVGKIQQEALGEVQEMIDICDFAVGLSRQLYGLTMASERPLHRLTEQWHPLGPVGILSAFNFPVAVWAWNAALALVCGDSLVWKPSEKAPLCALACHALLQQTTQTMPEAPQGLSNVIIGGREAGQALAQHPGLPLISATGSVPMGRSVAQAVGKRLGRSLLELGGNNAMIIAPSADLELAIRAAVFAAVGTAGQRCTSLRRLILHDSLYQGVVERLQRVYQALPVGDPRADTTLVGPLIDEAAAGAMNAALEQARALGARVHFGDRLREDVPPGGVYVRPALVEIEATAPLLQHEVFAPVLYLMRYHDFEQAIALNNGVPQGLASALFTNDMREAEAFCAATGSDCGIANVNIGTSGAEIGGAFGGEKDTGGGRESGSDAWKNYMRRATNTVNFSSALPLAQGIRFDS